MHKRLSLKQELGLKLFQKYRESETKLHELRYIFWECTLRCNLHCRHCGSECQQKSMIKDMPKEDFLQALDEVLPIINPHKTTIVLTGGEPTLRNDLPEIGKELYKRELPWGIVSNGSRFSKAYLLQLLNAGLRSATISLDGLEHAHNWLRGNSLSFIRAIHAIRLLQQSPDIHWDVVSCIHQHNFNELNQLKDLLIKLKVKEWRIFTIFPVGRAKNTPALKLNNIQFTELMKFISNVRKEGKIKLNYSCEGFLGSYEGKVRDHFFFCRAGINIASVLADGSISACPDLRNHFIQGNIYENNLKEIWENKYQLHRNRDWAKTGICSACNYFKFCQGNGLHLRDEINDGPMFCHLKELGLLT